MEALLPDLATTYGPLAALGLYLWVNRPKTAPVEDAGKDIRESLRRIEADLVAVRAILTERKHD
jgi:hypothetical protein